ncbi:unnamed protein product [Coccothraustes coccothraustes]
MLTDVLWKAVPDREEEMEMEMGVDVEEEMEVDVDLEEEMEVDADEEEEMEVEMEEYIEAMDIDEKDEEEALILA